MLSPRFPSTVTVTTRTDFADAAVPGLALRVTPTGAKSWSLRYRFGGRAHRVTLGTFPSLSLAQARDKARKTLGAVAMGHNPAEAKRSAARGHTVADLARDYIRDHAKVHKRSWEADDRMLNVEVLPHWRSRKVRDLTRRDVRALVEGIAQRGSPISANRCLALIRGMLNFGIRRDWLEANPAALIEKPGAERSRDRVLSDYELRLFWRLLDLERPTMAALMKLRLLTAQRGGELSGLRWTDIEADAFTIPADVAKNGRAHRVPVTVTVAAILASLPRVNEWVFPGRSDRAPMSDAKKAGQRMQDRMIAAMREHDPVAVLDFRGHDLRRTAATRMAASGIPQAHISRVLNHVDRGPRATAVYQRYDFDREKRVALETWDRELQRILEDHPQTGTVTPFAR